MPQLTRVFSGEVRKDWVDYNGHMGDYAYAIVFSDAITAYMDTIGCDAPYRRETGCTLYTMEMRIAYLRECKAGQRFHVLQQMLDADGKRFHSYMRMVDDASGEDAAVAEQLLMHMHRDPATSVPRARAFPDTMRAKVEADREEHRAIAVPAWIDAKIGIRRR